MELNKWNILVIMFKNLVKVYEIGDLYYYDLDSYNLIVNCFYILIREMLEGGFNIGYGIINVFKRIEIVVELLCILL